MALTSCTDIPDELRDEASLKDCSSVFNNSTHFCYDGSVYPRCNGVRYNPTTHICQGDVANVAKCGNSQYNPLESGSCGSSKYTLSSQFCKSPNVVRSLCGTATYASSQFCCGSAIGFSATQFCSGSQAYNLCSGREYDPANQRCQKKDIETR